ncbi:Hypp702 [Branchiostoma lanceolatum]|nr:Hypp702 [Branchiostoma lanceolatum]
MSDEENGEEDGKPLWLVKPVAFRSAELFAALCRQSWRLGENTGQHTRLVLERTVCSARDFPPPLSTTPQTAYDHNLATLHFTSDNVPRPKNPIGLFKISISTSTPHDRQTAPGRQSLVFQDSIDFGALEVFNGASFVEWGL